LPFASVVVYTNGVGPPGVSGVGAGCPTTSGVVVARGVVRDVADVVGDVAVGMGVVVREVLVATGTDVAPGPPRVCNVCVIGWPKALVAICTTMVAPA